MIKRKTTLTGEHKETKETEHTDIKENRATSPGKGLAGDGRPEDGKDEVAEEEKPGAGETAPDKSVSAVMVIEEKLAEMQDRYLRLSAEFDNYRKRTLKEKIEMTKYAGENIISKLLPFMDDFDRAVKHMETTSECAPLKEGLDLIHSKFSEFLKSQGVKEIESLKSNFDVDLHEAVAKIPVEEEDKKGRVVDVVLKGYYLHDKVIRHSKVVIGE